MQTRIVQTCLIAVAACGVARAQAPASAPYWPGVEWRTATPESQGLDSQALASAIEQVRRQKWGTHSLLVIRHGFAVAAADFYPYRSTAPHDVASVTKTITSTLTGVAVANGLLTLDQKVLSFFPAESPADADARKRAITVENLLRMSRRAQSRRARWWNLGLLARGLKTGSMRSHAAVMSPGLSSNGSVRSKARSGWPD